MQDTKFQPIQAIAANKNLNLKDFTIHQRAVLIYTLGLFLYKKQPLGRYLDISAKHFIKGGGRVLAVLTGKKNKGFSHFGKHLNQLIELGIFNRTDSYSTHKNQCKCIRFSDSFLQNAKAWEGLQVIETKYRKRTRNRLIDTTDTHVRKLRLTKGLGIESTINGLITKDYVSDKFTTDYTGVETGVYWAVHNKLKLDTPITLKKALFIAAQENKVVYHHKKGRILIIGERNFRTIKLAELKRKYSYLLNCIKHKNYFPTSISDTNDRLTSFYTVLPNILLQFVTLSNKPLISFDIANSQFTFLANIIQSYYKYRYDCTNENPLYKLIEQDTIYANVIDNSFNKLLENGNGRLTASTNQFIKDACSGQLYEQVIQRTHLTRLEAKIGFFSVAFAKPKHQSELKGIIRKLYPQVIDFIDTFKTLCPTENKAGFAVFLQRIESSVCVGEILAKNQGKYTLLTRHDSFTSDSTRMIELEQDITHVLDRFLDAGYCLKCE